MSYEEQQASYENGRESGRASGYEATIREKLKEAEAGGAGRN